MSNVLELESLDVDTFSPAGVGDLSFAAVAAAQSYSDCGSCGIDCTAVEPC